MNEANHDQGSNGMLSCDLSMNHTTPSVRIVGALMGFALAFIVCPIALADSPPVPLTTILQPRSDDFGNSVAMSPDTLVVGAANLSGAAGPVFIYDKNLAPGWGLRTTIAIPAARPAGFGQGVAHNGGDVVAVLARDAAYLYQRSLGGADAWGLLATVPKMASSTALLSMAFSGDWLALVEQDAAGVRRVTMHLRDNPSPNSWSTFVTLTNPLPAFGMVPFAGSVQLEGNLLLVTGQESGTGLLLHAYRKDQDGVNFWGRVGTLRPSNLAGVLFFYGTPALSGGRAVFAARRSATPSQNSPHAVVPPSASGGSWTLEHFVNHTGAVAGLFAVQIKACGTDRYAVTLVRQLGPDAVFPGASQGYVAVYRGAGILEQETPVGSPVFLDEGDTLPSPSLQAAAGVFAARSRASASPTEQVTPQVLEVHEQNAGGTGAWGLTKSISAPSANPGRFGSKVSISGLLMAVGDPEDSFEADNGGAVHLYERSHVLKNDWKRTSTVRPSPPVTGARFGTDVDVAENGLVVASAPGVDQVLVMRGGSILAQLTRPPGINAGEGFADAVAITPSGADIFVGTPRAFGQGSATVRTGAVVHFRATTPSNPTFFSHFSTYRGTLPADHDALLGSTIDATESTLAAGGWAAEDVSSNPQGMVAVWERSGSTVGFTIRNVLAPPDPSRGLFGVDVALGQASDGSLRLLVGTTPPLFGSNLGGAFLFSRNPYTDLWYHEKNFFPNGAPQSGYGMSVALNDGVAVIGSPGENTAGAVEIFFENDGAIFNQRRKLFPGWPTAGEGFGSAVAFDNVGLAVASPLVDRVTTFRFGGYERWLGKNSIPGLRTFSGPWDDPDGDGRPNVMEFAGGGNPLSGSGPHGERFQMLQDSGIAWFQWNSQRPWVGERGDFNDVAVSIERSLDGIVWGVAPAAVPSSSPSAPGFYHANPPPGQSENQMFRFRVVYPFFH